MFSDMANIVSSIFLHEVDQEAKVESVVATLKKILFESIVGL